jgi:hypothetical protein
MRSHASSILTAAALGTACMVSLAGAQDDWSNANGYQSHPLQQSGQIYRQYQGYEDNGLIAPTGNHKFNYLQQQPVSAPSDQSWDRQISRVAQLESQLRSLETTRVAELEQELSALTERLDASGELLQQYGEPNGIWGSCGACGSGCCEPCCPPVQTGWYAGLEFLFLKPHFDNGTAFLSSQNGEIANRSNAVSHEFDYDYDLSTRIFLGYTNDCGLGFRTRYFHYDHDSSTPSVTVPAIGDIETPAIQPYLGSGQHFFMDNGGASTFRAGSSLELQSWDLEATSQLTFCRSLVTVGCGLRYLLNEQRYSVDAIHANGHIQESLFNEHDFEGIGPTFSVELLRPFSCCSCLSMYCNVRGSALFGESDQEFRKVDGTTGVTTETFARSGADDSVYIGEIGMGLQYDRGIFYGRAGMEGQYWHSAGGPTTTDTDIGLLGLTLTLGLNY